MNAATEPTPTTSEPPSPPQGVASLRHLGVIEVTGADNTQFLQGQLTNDLSQLSTSQGRLAAFCSAKGRMQASFIAMRRENGDILLVCSQDLLTATVKRLSIFVLRAKAALRDATADYALYGLIGDTAEGGDADLGAPWAACTTNGASVVQLYPAQGLARQLWLVPTGASAPSGPAMSLEDWQCSEVLSGVATLTAPVVDALVPQMLNYESVGGVSFKKGCYPGQEVVARSQFRGTLKRRAFIVALQHSAPITPNAATEAAVPAITDEPAPLFAGQELYCTQDTSQPCGLVVQAAHTATQQWFGLVSMQISAATGSPLSLGSAQGPQVALLDLPYALLEDI